MRLIHRLTLLRYGIPPTFVLNPGPASIDEMSPAGAMPAEPVAADLRRIRRRRATLQHLRHRVRHPAGQRAASRHPRPHFGKDDPRRQHSLARVDPRVHFALVCAARSCPPIGVYDAGRIDRQLDLAARTFVNGGGVVVDRSAGEVRLSRIFQWYAPDFGAGWLALGDKRPLLDFVARDLADDSARDFVQQYPPIRFLPYDWSLNGSPVPLAAR